MNFDAMLPRPSVPFIPAGPYERGLAWFEARGHDRRSVLLEAGVDARRVDDPAALLTLAEVEALVRRLAEAVRDPASAFEFGGRLLFTSHGALGFAGLTAPSVGAALDVAEKYLELVTPLFVLSSEELGAFRVVRLLPVYRMDPVVLRVHMSVMVSSLLMLARHAAGAGIAGIELELPGHDEHALSWSRQNGVVLRTGSDTLVARIPLACLSAPFALADRRAHAEALAQCDALLAAARTQQPTIRAVRRVLLQAAPSFPDLEGVSQRLGASPRTVSRHLRQEGASFRQLLDEARLSWAARALAGSDRSISAIAYDLGYSNPANFTRAFTRSVGSSPTAYRRAHGADVRGTSPS